ncbi:MAG: type II secretion system F family protein [Cellvibrionaceae bacterium]
MPVYHYYGRNSQGESVKGTIDRIDKNSVVDYLGQQQIIPVTIDIHNSSTISVNWSTIKKRLIIKKPSPEQLIMFCRQMHTISKAGIPLAQGIKNLAASISEGGLKVALLDIYIRLQSGMSLSMSMQRHKHIFDSLFINMVKVGENSGNLDAVFLQLSHYIERDFVTKKAIKSAARYPSFVLASMIIALVVINIFVVPAFADMFSKFNADLPIVTRILITSSNVFVNYWWFIIICVSIGLALFLYWVNTVSGRVIWDELKLKIPIVGPLINKASLARYTRSFAVMLKAGVPLSDSIGLCAKVIDNAFLSQKIDTIKNGVEHGDSLKRTHARSEVFTPLILQMITVGEDSGEVDNLLIDVADYYEREVEYELKSLSSKIEPLLIVVMALFVLLLGLGIFLPMWEMYNIQK